MALQIWLPLTSDTRNNGVSPVTVTNYSATFSDGGKLGKCYSFSAGNYMKATNVSIPTSTWSMAAWVNLSITSADGHKYIVGLNTSSSSDFLAVLCAYTNKLGVRISGTTYYSTVTYTTNTWYHLAATYDGTLKIYVNGVLDTTIASPVTPTAASTLYVGMRGGNTGYFAGKLNDVRVYDHALSVAEIKELAKGLIVHYKLDEFNSSDNLLINGFGELGSENWNDGSKISTTEIPPDHPEIKASMFDGVTTKQYIPMNKNHTYTISGYVKATASSGTTYPSIYPYDVDMLFINHYNTAAGFGSSYQTTLAQPLHKGDTVIYATDLSAWTTGDNYYFRVAIFGYKNSLGEVYPDMVYTQDCPAFGTKTDKSHIDKTNNTITLNAAYTGEDRPAGTKICQTTEGSTYYYPWGGIAISSITDWTFKTATFTPKSVNRLKSMAYMRWSTYGRCRIAGNKLVDTSAVDTRITDSSGYSYHGTRTGNMSISIAPARYSFCNVFDGSSSYIEINNDMLPTVLNGAFTLSVWIYNSDSGSRSILFGNYQLTGSFFNIEKTTTETVRFWWNSSPDIALSNTVLTANKFSHLVITRNGNTVKSYINGVLKDTSTATLNGTIPTTATTFRIGSDNRTGDTLFKGRMSDFRIYGSVLSADDVLALYNTGAKVSNTGAMLGYEMKEG